MELEHMVESPAQTDPNWSLALAFGAFGLYYLTTLAWLGLTTLAGAPDQDAVVGAGVGALVAIGFGLRQRLAWQWGRLLGFLIGGLTLLIVITPIAMPPVVTLVFLTSGGSLLTMAWALGKKPVREYFRLYCPSCGSEGKAANFFFSRARCTRCTPAQEW